MGPAAGFGFPLLSLLLLLLVFIVLKLGACGGLSLNFPLCVFRGVSDRGGPRCRGGLGDGLGPISAGPMCGAGLACAEAQCRPKQSAPAAGFLIPMDSKFAGSPG